MKRTANTQIARVLSYLQNNDDLSPLEAFGLFGTTRLASIIEDLRKEGHIIDTQIHKDINGKRYARYTYNGHSNAHLYGAKNPKRWSIVELLVAA
jgi:hypothetical protein